MSAKQKELNFIKNDAGIPLYDKSGETIRKALELLQERLDAGKNIYATGESISTSTIENKPDTCKEDRMGVPPSASCNGKREVPSSKSDKQIPVA